MALVLKSPQIHSTFSNLGFLHADGYHVNENCNAALENILHNILTEDKYLRAYRRSINFGQNIQKDLIPLLIHAKEDKTIELLLTILVNLSIPIECLLSVEETSQSNHGLHTVFELNQLLTAIKAAFTEPRATKAVLDFLKKNVVPQPKVSQEQCTNISNGLLLLRNVLHIPEVVNSSPGNNGWNHPVQEDVNRSPGNNGWNHPVQEEVNSSPGNNGWNHPVQEEVNSSPGNNGWNHPVQEEVNSSPGNNGSNHPVQEEVNSSPGNNGWNHPVQEEVNSSPGNNGSNHPVQEGVNSSPGNNGSNHPVQEEVNSSPGNNGSNHPVQEGVNSSPGNNGSNHPVQEGVNNSPGNNGSNHPVQEGVNSSPGNNGWNHPVQEEVNSSPGNNGSNHPVQEGVNSSPGNNGSNHPVQEGVNNSPGNNGSNHPVQEGVNSSPGNNGSNHPAQNQILWNLFSQSIDKLLIKLMTIPEANNWAVTMVQVVALLYKDQDVGTLQKLLQVWLESYNAESSEDNESNTSPPNRGSENSSPMLTSVPTSDSSDTGASGKVNEEPNCEKNGRGGSSEHPTTEDANQPLQPPSPGENDVHMRDHDAPPGDENINSDTDDKVVPEVSPTATVTAITNDQQPDKTENKAVISETSDFGYGAQIENQESISTSSNDDDLPSKKPVHQKPNKPKQKVNTKARTGAAPHGQWAECKKGTKRGKTNIINVQGPNQTPTDADVSNVMKEFTIEFLRKGYNTLVQTLHSEILTNVHLEIDTSHFFWLLTYFLKCVTQIELALEQISAVLSFDIVSFLTAEGVNVCEQFELAVKLDGEDVKPSGRRLHLVVTAIREFVQALEVYKMFPHICADDKDGLIILQDKMCETDELRSLLVLLLRLYKPRYHTKQYLQDLIITNHILLKFLDSGMRNMKYTGAASMADHLQQFAAPEVMHQYGLVLEQFAENSEFLNDCVFTVMHHVAGQLGSLTSLYEPNILKTFATIKISEFKICNDWTDLIEYVINSIIRKPYELPTIDNFRMVFDDDKLLTEQAAAKKDAKPEKKSARSSAAQSSNHRWTEEELSSLRWGYLQCNTLPDVVGEILKCLKEEGTVKTRDSVIRELHKKNIINKAEYEKLSKAEVQSRYCKKTQPRKETRDVEVGKLCEQLRQDGKTKCLDWVQQVLLDICFAKVEIEKRYLSECSSSEDRSGRNTFKISNQQCKATVMSPVSYRALILNESVPLVPWNSEQAAMCKNLYFLQLLYKLGFQMPVDSGKVFIRIPHDWPAGFVYKMAGRVAVVDTTKLKFSISDLTSSSSESTSQPCNSALPTDLARDVTSLISAPGSFYYTHKQDPLAAIGNFTPRAGSSRSGDAQPAAAAGSWCWLQLVQRSQQIKLTCMVGRVGSSHSGDAQPAAAAAAAVAGVSRGWLQLVQRPQQLKLTCTVGSVLAGAEMPEAPEPPRGSGADLDEDNSVSDTASVASDLTHMYVSDEEMELALRPSVVKPRAHRAERERERDLERVATRPWVRSGARLSRRSWPKL